MANLSKLFDFLLQKEPDRLESGLNEAKHLKKIEIVIEVFGKTTDFNSTEDASVRVSMSRLRKKLEQYSQSDRGLGAGF